MHFWYRETILLLNLRRSVLELKRLVMLFSQLKECSEKFVQLQVFKPDSADSIFLVLLGSCLCT